MNCLSRFAVPKHVIKIPPLQAGRRVSWTFEVSAAAGAEKGARAKKSSRKRRRAKSVVKRTRTSAAHHEPPVVPEPAQPCAATPTQEGTAEPMAASVEEALIPLVTPQVAQHPPLPVRQATHFRAIALVAATFLVVAVLAFPRHPSAPSPDAGTAGSRLEPTEPVADLVGSSPHQAALPSAPLGVPVAASEAVAPRAAAIAPTKKALVPKPEKNHVAESTKSGAPIAAVTPVAVIPLKDDAAKLPGFEAIPAPASASVSTGVGAIAPVTITGCLEVSVDQGEFRLTDTEGVDAPKSRSWRTGFLKKRSAPVALVEPPERLALQTHVGRRVSATGLLTSHDLKVSALRVVGPSCN